MATPRRVSRAGILAFLAALLAPHVAYSSTPAQAPPLPEPAGNVVHVASEAELQDAVANVRSYQTIVLAPGVYHLTRTLWINRPLQQVVLRGATNNRDDVVLVGPGMTHASYGLTPHAIWVGGVEEFMIANLTIRDVYQDGLVVAPGSDMPIVYNVHFVDVGKSFVESTTDGPGQGVNDGLIEYSIFEFTSTTRDADAIGISIHGGARWTIANSLFRNIVASSYQLAGPAILMSAYSTNTLVDGNTFVNCSRGVMFGRPDADQGDHAGGVVRNNMFYRASGQPGDTAIAINGSPYTQILNNSVFVSGTYGTPIEYRYAGAHDLLVANNLLDGSTWARDGATAVEAANLTSATPDLFVDASSGDLHLSPSAARAIDRGIAVPSVSTDWDGGSRPVGRGWDIGADERASVASQSTLNRSIVLAASDAPVFIGGRVTTADPTGVTGGAGVAGVTVTLSGGRSLSVTTDATGIYLFSGVALGVDYTITPSRAGTIFTPTSFVVTGLNGTITNANFQIWSGTADGGTTTSPGTSDPAPPDDSTPPPSGSVFDPTPVDDPNPDPAPPDPAPTTDPSPAPGTPAPGPAPITPPTVVVTSPLDNSSYTAPATLTIAAGASAGTGTLSHVDFYAGSTRLKSDFTAPYSVGWTNVAAGTYVIKAVAFNSAGASAESNTVTVTITDPPPPPPLPPPTVTMTAPVDSQTFTAPASVTLRANASTSNGSITKVEFYSGSTLIATDTTWPYSRSWNNVAAGTYTLTAVATDSNGLKSTSSAVGIVVSPAAVVPPTVTLTSPASGSAYTAPAAITVSANASTSSGSISKVDFYAGATLIGSDTTAPYSVTWNGAAAGSYAITAKATTSTGATNTSSPVNITITASLSAPTANLTSPSNGSTFSAPASITVSANATTASGSITRVDFYAGSSLIGSDTSSPYSITWNNVPAGSYSVFAVATSSAGLTGQSSAFSVTVASPSTPPTVSMTAPANGSTYTSPATVSLSASASTATGTITSVSFYANGTLIATDTSTPYTASWSNVSAGSYSITAKATNSSGLSTTSSAVSITVSDPAPPSGGGGGGGGSPSPSGASSLDDFSGPIRITSSGDAIWQHYAEGASGSVSVSGGILTESVGGVTNSNGGGVYLEFYPKGNAGYTFPSGYAQNWIQSGTWNSQYNRLTFRVKASSSIPRSSDGSALFEVGTYIRNHSNTDQSWQGDHYYHRLSPNVVANRWIYVTINRVPQHQVGDNGVTNYPENPDGVPYFDGLTRFYFDGIYGAGANMTWQYDDFTFSQVGGEPDTLVASVTGTYTGSRYEVSWQTPKNSNQQYTVHYSTSSMKDNGFASGTNGGTVNATGNTYTGAFWASPNMSQSATGIYIAIQPVGQTAFTEIFIPNS